MLHSFGSNSHSQLSLPPTDTATPTPCHALPHPPTVVSGSTHTLLLTTAPPHLLATGNNTSHQLHPTLPDTVPTFTPVPLPTPTSTILAAAAGPTFTILATATGVSSTGTGTRGELGRPSTPSDGWGTVPIPAPVTALSTCVAHVVAVCADGRVYGWGSNRHGQLGAGGAAVVAAPVLIEPGWKVAWGVCGRAFTVLVEAAEGDAAVRRVAVLGQDRWGVAKQIGGVLVGVRDVQAGWGTVWVWFWSGELRGYGRGARVVEGVEKCAVGSEHGVVVVAGRLWAWGWGEHGNCGPGGVGGGVGGQGGEKQMWEVKIEGLDDSMEIGGVGAGWATSWVWVGKKAVE